MTKRDFEKHDGAGLALFAAGVFCAALVVPAMFSGPSAVVVPAGTSPGFVPLIAATWVGAIGAWPSFAFTAPVAVLGAWLFLRGPIAGLLRHIVGIAFLAVGLAILLGAFSETAGGTFGARIGGGIAAATHVAFGALIGVLALAATVWFVWLKHDTLVDEEPVNVRNPELESEADANDDGVSREEAEALLPKELPRVVPAAQRVPVFAPPPSPYPEDVRKRGEIPAGARPIATADSAGGSSLGAPSTAYRWTAPGARTAETQTAPQPEARETEPGERTGDRYTLADEARELPAGAQALASGAALEGGALRIANVPSASWENADDDQDSADDDIAVDAYGTPLTLVEALRKESASPAAPRADTDELEEPEIDDDVEGEDFETDAEDELVASAERAEDESDDEAFAEEDDDELADETPEAARAPHIVEAELFAAVEAEADRQFAQRTRVVAEPGTPAPVVYAVRAELGAVAQDTELDAVAQDAELDAVAQAGAEPAVSAAPTELAPSAPLAVVQETLAVTEIESAEIAVDELADEELDEFDELEAGASALAADAEAGDELDAEDDEVSDEEELEDAETELAADEVDEEEEFLTEALAADELDARAEDKAAHGAAAAADTSDEADDEEDAADDETAENDDSTAPDALPARADRGEPLPVAGKLSDARTRGQELLDFDLRTAAAAAVPASSVFVSDTPEREVVLTPPAVAAERSIKAPAGKPDGDRAALLAEVGCLFIDRKRVAVSMLQRQYSMDFDDACRVLDELQSMGLIGPYLGGQSRDILLTREEWLEKVGAS